MAADWQETELGNVITLQRGFDLPAQDRKPGSVPIVSSSGISGTHSEARVSAPGVVTGRYGTIGQVFFVDQDFLPLNTTLFVKDFKGNDPRFASYLLRTIDFRSCSDKSSVPGINRNHLHRLRVRVPALAEQRGIAHILSTLDDKIELNRRMNATLEAIAHCIFKAWFVDFDPVRAKADGRQPYGMDAATAALFPDSFHDSCLGQIPSGWKVDEIRARASNVQYGLTRSAATDPVGPRFLRITDIQGGRADWSRVPFCPVSAEERHKYRICPGDILIARTGASTGENIYIIEAPDAVFASYLVRIQFADLSLARVVGEYMRTAAYFDYVAGAIGGSAQPNASAQVLASGLFTFPPLSV